MEQQENSISVKDAVERATRVITDLYSDYQLKNVLLEEVRLLGDKWLVTIGFTRPPQGTTSIGPLTFPERAYKQIEIDAKTGEFLGMEIREFQTKQAERLEQHLLDMEQNLDALVGGYRRKGIVVDTNQQPSRAPFGASKN